MTTPRAPRAQADLDRLSAGKYVLLTTFRRDGRAVGTAVWVVRDGDALGAWTARDSGKVKRLRNSGRVTVAQCDARGNARGAAVAGHAELLDEAGTERYRGLIRRKFGVLGRLTLLGSRLRRGTGATIGIRIELTAPAEPERTDGANEPERPDPVG
ncbi:PPOX class F420-dependent oxidoreductase [Streptomyces sp. SID3343]|uniref:PPOX class F420-dependent oxidoreductase n=1 Tax=Streptomyces sp. SID3343 TaxID=2690260 RepID=UPI001367DBB5|nr:PPOX class F420-dependent oxidoreductase [Streptomyces sp. SID3343]MYV98972.1 PPOX class F420-dependent oxidoreductase [Streptomyces sp. SID3343]